jgi:DNA modification methylase
MIAPDLQPLAQPIETLHTLEGNPRRGDVEAVARSYDRFGQRKPIVARRDGTVIAGNHQLLAARSLGWTKIAVVYVDDDDLTASAYALADNRTADLGDYDEELLANLLQEVAVDTDLLLASGYTTDDLNDLLASLEPEELPFVNDPEDISDAPPAKTVPGDLWLLGNHRLICGDSTDPDVYTRLLEGTPVDMVWTDPPYGIAYVGKTADALTIMNDDLSLDELEALLRTSLGNAYQHSRPGASWYVSAPQGGSLFHTFGKVLLDLEVWRHTLIWVKDQFVMGRADYHYRHEPIFYGWKEGDAHTWESDRKQDSVLEFDRPKRSREHPTMKPIALVDYCIRNSTKPRNMVLDPFGGSGTTLLACEATNRDARTIELDPHYADVICARYQKATGNTPIHGTTGQPHNFLPDE